MANGFNCSFDQCQLVEFMVFFFFWVGFVLPIPPSFGDLNSDSGLDFKVTA